MSEGKNQNNQKKNENTILTTKEDTANITKNDIKLMLNILNIISKRGGFILDEYEIIGEFNKRLKALVT